MGLSVQIAVRRALILKGWQVSGWAEGTGERIASEGVDMSKGMEVRDNLSSAGVREEPTWLEQNTCVQWTHGWLGRISCGTCWDFIGRSCGWGRLRVGSLLLLSKSSSVNSLP